MKETAELLLFLNKNYYIISYICIFQMRFEIKWQF